MQRPILLPALRCRFLLPGAPAAEDAAKHRKERGEEEPMSPQKSGLGRHVGEPCRLGGIPGTNGLQAVADLWPVHTQQQVIAAGRRRGCSAYPWLPWQGHGIAFRIG